ncbi:imidazolonepropionase-like domain-containing protein [Streptomyces sp. NPDC102274]|uniref:imidazolonepropionase-like domain-containing protein n=1 Tax=Streptomyces sp. NPDC102274 TaxID=3366151 RepID=UPI003818E859
MQTLHVADEVRRTWDAAEPIVGGAVVVAGDRIGAVGTFEELRERFPDARVRKWAGVLGPARVHEGPLPDAPTPRERIHAVLKLGAVVVLGEFATAPGLRAAAARVGVLVLPTARSTEIAETGRADLAVFDADGRCLATVCAGRLVHRRA